MPRSLLSRIGEKKKEGRGGIFSMGEKGKEGKKRLEVGLQR